MEPLPGEAHHVVVEVDVVGVPVQREQSNNLKKNTEKRSKQIADAVWLTYKEWMWEKRSIKETLMHIKDSISNNVLISMNGNIVKTEFSLKYT